MKVLSIEQITRLKELGVDVNSLRVKAHFSYNFNEVTIQSIGLNGSSISYRLASSETINMVTLEDVFDLLPKEIVVKKVSYQLNWNPLNGSLRYDNMYGDEGTILYGCCYIEEEGILDAAYDMLIWVIENGHLKTN